MEYQDCHLISICLLYTLFQPHVLLLFYKHLISCINLFPALIYFIVFIAHLFPPHDFPFPYYFQLPKPRDD